MHRKSGGSKPLPTSLDAFLDEEEDDGLDIDIDAGASSKSKTKPLASAKPSAGYKPSAASNAAGARKVTGKSTDSVSSSGDSSASGDMDAAIKAVSAARKRMDASGSVASSSSNPLSGSLGRRGTGASAAPRPGTAGAATGITSSSSFMSSGAGAGSGSSARPASAASGRIGGAATAAAKARLAAKPIDEDGDIVFSDDDLDVDDLLGDSPSAKTKAKAKSDAAKKTRKSADGDSLNEIEDFLKDINSTLAASKAVTSGITSPPTASPAATMTAPATTTTTAGSTTSANTTAATPAATATTTPAGTTTSTTTAAAASVSQPAASTPASSTSTTAPAAAVSASAPVAARPRTLPPVSAPASSATTAATTPSTAAGGNNTSIRASADSLQISVTSLDKAGNKPAAPATIAASPAPATAVSSSFGQTTPLPMADSLLQSKDFIGGILPGGNQTGVLSATLNAKNLTGSFDASATQQPGASLSATGPLPAIDRPATADPLASTTGSIASKAVDRSSEGPLLSSPVKPVSTEPTKPAAVSTSIDAGARVVSASTASLNAAMSAALRAEAAVAAVSAPPSAASAAVAVSPASDDEMNSELATIFVASWIVESTPAARQEHSSASAAAKTPPPITLSLSFADCCKLMECVQPTALRASAPDPTAQSELQSLKTRLHREMVEATNASTAATAAVGAAPIISCGAWVRVLRKAGFVEVDTSPASAAASQRTLTPLLQRSWIALKQQQSEIATSRLLDAPFIDRLISLLMNPPRLPPIAAPAGAVSDPAAKQREKETITLYRRALGVCGYAVVVPPPAPSPAAATIASSAASSAAEEKKAPAAAAASESSSSSAAASTPAAATATVPASEASSSTSAGSKAPSGVSAVTAAIMEAYAAAAREDEKSLKSGKSDSAAAAPTGKKPVVALSKAERLKQEKEAERATYGNLDDLSDLDEPPAVAPAKKPAVASTTTAAAAAATPTSAASTAASASGEAAIKKKPIAVDDDDDDQPLPSLKKPAVLPAASSTQQPKVAWAKQNKTVERLSQSTRAIATPNASASTAAANRRRAGAGVSPAAASTNIRGSGSGAMTATTVRTSADKSVRLSAQLSELEDYRARVVADEQQRALISSLQSQVGELERRLAGERELVKSLQSNLESNRKEWEHKENVIRTDCAAIISQHQKAALTSEQKYRDIVAAAASGDSKLVDAVATAVEAKDGKSNGGGIPFVEIVKAGGSLFKTVKTEKEMNRLQREMKEMDALITGLNRENVRLLKEVKLSINHAKGNEQQLFHDIQTRDATIEELKKDVARAQTERLASVTSGTDSVAKQEIKRLTDEFDAARRNHETEKSELRFELDKAKRANSQLENKLAEAASAAAKSIGSPAPAPAAKRGGAPPANESPAAQAVGYGALPVGGVISRVEYDRKVLELQSRLNWYVENQSLISELESKLAAKEKIITALQSQLDTKQRFAPIPLKSGNAAAGTSAAANKKGAAAAASAGGAGGGVVVNAAGVVAVDASGNPMTVRAMASENDELRAQRTKDIKRIKLLETSVKQLQTELSRKDPNSIAALIRATKPTLAEADQSSAAREQVTKLEAAAATATAEYEKSIRALRQEHDKTKADFEKRIASLQLELSKKPLPKGRANQRIEELTKQLTDIRAAHLKKVRTLERQIEAKQNTAHLQPPVPAPAAAAAASTATSAATSTVAASNPSAVAPPHSGDAKSDEKHHATAVAPPTSAIAVAPIATASGGDAAAPSAGAAATASASAALAALSEQLALAQQQISALNNDRYALIAKLQHQQTLQQHTAMPTPAALIPPPPGLSASNAEYISRLEAQFRTGQQQVLTATTANARSEERARAAERALADAQSSNTHALASMKQQISSLTGQVEWLTEEKKRAEQAATNAEWQIKQLQSQPSYTEYQNMVNRIESMEKRYKARQLQLQRAAATFEEQFELDRTEQRLKFEATLRQKNAQIERFKSELEALLQQMPGNATGAAVNGGPGSAAAAASAASSFAGLPY